MRWFEPDWLQLIAQPLSHWAKSPKKQSVGVYFWNSRKRTPLDCFLAILPTGIVEKSSRPE